MTLAWVSVAIMLAADVIWLPFTRLTFVILDRRHHRILPAVGIAIHLVAESATQRSFQKTSPNAEISKALELDPIAGSPSSIIYGRQSDE